MRKKKQDQLDEIELKFNVEWNRTNKDITGWVANIKVISYFDESEKEYTALLIYLLTIQGDWIKCMYEYMPYFYVDCEIESIREVSMQLETKYEKYIAKVDIIERLDLEQINHLAGKLKQYIKLSFRIIGDLIYVRNQLKYQLEKNNKNTELHGLSAKSSMTLDLFDQITDIREFDVPYHCRVCIDTDLRCSKWFTFKMKERKIMQIIPEKNLISLPDLKYISFDIETSKQPLKFPDSKTDKIIMISLTHCENSILITNKEFIPIEVKEFDYAPKPEFATNVIVYNEEDEKSLLMRFFQVIVDYKPLIISSFNGDRFDWPFIEERSLQNGYDIEKEIGIKRSEETQEYFGRFLIHMDCFAWVERDAYLPQGSHGLKAVTRAKLHYEPVEVEPEKMMKMAYEQGQQFAEYSISDSVATYWLYRKHIHDFILALCTIIPLQPDEVLRKGSGTLCECLLMAMAYSRQIVFPNKKKEPLEKFHEGHLLDSETYIGGKVECLRCGIYRSDIDVEFKIDKEEMMRMHTSVERLLHFLGRVENHEFSEEEIDRVSKQIRLKLDGILQKGEVFQEKPLIYHLDVAAMYPNIILTNRLQPVSIVNNRMCSGCVFNENSNNCKRELFWQKKVDYYPLQRNEYESVKMTLEYEILQKGQRDMEQKMKQLRLQGEIPNQNIKLKGLSDLPFDQQQKLLKQRVKLYSQMTYKTVHLHQIIQKKDTVCMRENDFYVQAVRDFRDRRYEFKELVKVYKAKAEEAKLKGENQKPHQDMMALYDSLQLAHKIILNSFYGYVMRKGARWFSMQMAGIVTHMGSAIISSAKQWVDMIGLPLELDTDGIWCLLPTGFPEDFTIRTIQGKNIKFSYPCHILNERVFEKYKNSQYQQLKDVETLDYETRSEMSIFFEVDGPYRCMIIPAAREENKQLKKRYVVFNKNGSIAEVKGFEIKRRGELKIIKLFQQGLFTEFLKGTNLNECYNACAKVAQKFLNILKSGGQGIPDEELLDYIGESRVLSKDILEYEAQKGVAITAGKRIAEYLGNDQMKGAGINCLFIISKLPHNTPVNERSIPIMVFEGSVEIKRKFLKRWLKDAKIKDEDLTLQKIVDWNYYIERFSKTIQKLLVIPAALQKVSNPIPDVIPPEWLNKRIREQLSRFQQQKIKQYFKYRPISQKLEILPIVKEQQQQTIFHLEHNKYDMETDFKRFLKEQQRIWSWQFKNKESLQNISGNIKNLFQTQSLSNKKSNWHILQVHEKQPGVFQVFYLLDNGQLMKDFVTVPRTIYVNSHIKQTEGTIVKRWLPREKKILFLYEITMSEEKFITDYTGFSQFIANPDYEGIYENQMPLIFKFITEIGHLCKLSRECIESKRTQFTIKDLQPLFDLSSGRYIPNIPQQLLIIQQLQIQENTGVWCILSIEELVIIIVRKGNEKVSTEYTKQINELIDVKRKILKLPEKNKTLIYLFNSDQLALDYIEQHCSAKANQHKLCVIQSTQDSTYLRNKGLHFLFDDIPTLFLPKTNEQLKHEFQWEKNCVKIFLEFYGQIQTILTQQISIARDAAIPLCNITNAHIGVQDTLSDNLKYNYYIDVQYQRTIKSLFTGISWYGQGLGRNNQDLIPTEYTQKQQNNPGIYMSYCVELQVLHFSLNTILLSDELKNVDRETSIMWNTDCGDNVHGKTIDNLDELTAAKMSFKILKLLVQNWLTDVEQKDSDFADKNMQNVQLWVYSGQSPLYDPYLGKMLDRLNFKIFNYFSTKLIQLGAQLIHCSMNKLIIGTSKQTINQAKSYVEYVIETIKQDPLFKYIHVTPQTYYKALIYRDTYNYMGHLDEYENDQKIEFQSNLKNFLSHICQQTYDILLSEILVRVVEFKEEQLMLAQEESNKRLIKLHADLEQEMIKFIIDYINNQTQNKLYQLIEKYQTDYTEEKKNYELQQEMEKTLPIVNENINRNKRIIEDENSMQIENEDEEYSDDSFIVSDDNIDNGNEKQLIEKNVNLNFKDTWIVPNTLGCTTELDQSENGLIQMLNYLCVMLQVNDEVDQMMRKIKSNCCRQLKISEYSKKATFIEPCIELIIQNVVCYECKIVLDIDIFKQDWLCFNCQEQYSTKYMEERICQYLESQLLFYQTQDIYCQKCKQAQDYQFQDKCPCSGSFVIRTDQFKKCFIHQQEQLLVNLLKLAKSHNLVGLSTLVNSIII